ncbi:unnamed protein product [Litomosoides sigmodontis]|uniref:Uncharacterized protein n=1 Tax=Litomosoides sigmodontis TaxID=42156 RepID=A0A3P6SRX3_LITSI|nr:unnamed protein product [Litomosoides sigmodontis]
MRRSYTIGADESDKQSGKSSRRISRVQRWSLALRRHWFSSTSGKTQESTDNDFNEITFAAPEKTVLGDPFNNDGSSTSCSTDRSVVDPSFSSSNIPSSTQNITKRKSLRRFFSNGQQQQEQQGPSSSGHSRPQSVSLTARKGDDHQLRHSAADPLHSGSSSLTEQQSQVHLLPKDLVESDLTVVGKTSTAGGSRSVLSSYDDQTTPLTAEQKEASTAGRLLSVHPSLIDPEIESTASFPDQAEFDLPPPMSELSSAVADAAASRNTSVGFVYFHALTAGATKGIAV